MNKSKGIVIGYSITMIIASLLLLVGGILDCYSNFTDNDANVLYLITGILECIFFVVFLCIAILGFIVKRPEQTVDENDNAVKQKTNKNSLTIEGFYQSLHYLGTVAFIIIFCQLFLQVAMDILPSYLEYIYIFVIIGIFIATVNGALKRKYRKTTKYNLEISDCIFSLWFLVIGAVMCLNYFSLAAYILFSILEAIRFVYLLAMLISQIKNKKQNDILDSCDDNSSDGNS